MDAKDMAQRKAATYGVEPGMIYRHYKGGLYTVVAVGIIEETLVPVAVYHSNLKGSTSVRTLENFTQFLNDRNELYQHGHPHPVPRFTRVRE